MNSANRLFLLVLCLSFLSKAWGAAWTGTPADTTSMTAFFMETKAELEALKQDYLLKIAPVQERLGAVNRELAKVATDEFKPEHFRLLLEKMRLEDDLKTAYTVFDVSITKARYAKGIELIKMMYEKILGLDHHFTSLQTYQSIMQMSNPNAYPEFQQAKDVLQKRLEKKNAIQLPNLLQANPFVSATFTLVASFLGEAEPKKKEADLEKIACILDFTLRMTNDLNVIYYETEFLKENNKALKEECMALFEAYTKVIGYNVPLDKCRKEDDWETLRDLLDKFVADLEKTAALKDERLMQEVVYKGQINLEFAVDRLLDFLNKYSAFIAQGEKYYQKFQVIVSNYQNEIVCAGQLPPQFATLKQEIGNSIAKFNEAYNIAELKGSKLKDLLYGY
ncbi:MAG: hypothetical protein EPO28_16835 [Saprospiraceae bacterium]|nr:MAG: hypothetical protein EPO28_16835 [Saprospiraceae bacterium]